MHDVKKLFKVVAASALAVTVFSSAVQAACTQNRAVYRDQGDAYTLTFHAAQSNALKMNPAPTNEFTITADDKPEFKLSGLVIWPEEGLRAPTRLLPITARTGHRSGRSR